VEEHSNRHRTPFLYNGKELDDETGLYYYGARYYDPVMSIWPSVDPLAEERSWVSPYNYVQNNPIRRIDPDGRLDDEYSLNKETGEIKFVKETEGNDYLVDSKSGNVISRDVEKGLLYDGQNIMKDGLQTENVKGGLNLVKDISMYTYDEVGGTVYENSNGETYLDVSPYKHSTFTRDANGKVINVTGGFSLPGDKRSFTSKDGKFTGSPKFSFHTHPGHPDGVGNIGTAIPSGPDIGGALGSGIPQVIFGGRSATYGGQTGNVSITDVPSVKGTNGSVLPGGVPRTRMIQR
jgi:RHS repeat-associated protein